jgi:hypothetical protein
LRCWSPTRSTRLSVNPCSLLVTKSTRVRAISSCAMPMERGLCFRSG